MGDAGAGSFNRTAAKEARLILKKQVANVNVPTAPPADARIPAHGARLPVGSILQGRYRIVGPLGAGGMSVVYKALDLHFTNVERVCAIKEMFDFAGDERTRQLRVTNFEREAGFLAILSHPLIPKIFDFFLENGRIYLVQEFIPGRNLEVVVDETPRGFEEAEVTEWGIQICGVLAYLHGQQPAPVIFRDMKPSNIMLRDDRSLVLIDFGIARTFQPLQRGTMIGTEGYAPPEQYRGIADVRGDVYALGATLHHLVTGSDPRFETPFTFEQRPPRQFKPLLSPQFEAVILRAVAYDPADRFANVNDFRSALLECPARLVSARPSSVVPDAPAPPVARPRPIPTRMFVPPRTEAPADESPTRVVAKRREMPVPERLHWAATSGDEVRGSGAVTGDLLLIGSYDTQLYAIDLVSGGVRWRYGTGRGICSTPALWRESVIFGSEDGAVYGVNLEGGTLKWRFRTNMPVRSSPRVASNVAFVGSDDSYVYKLDAASGDLLWRYRTYGPVRSSAALVDDLAIVGSDDGFLYALSQSTGRQVWRFATSKPVFASPAVDPALGVVICGSLDGSIYGLGVTQGELRWRLESGGPVIATAALHGGKAYIGSTGGRFYALDIATGERLWDVAHGNRVTSSAAVTDGYLYYGGLDGVFYCLDRETGAQVWSYQLGRPIPASPVLSERADQVIIGGTDGKIYALVTGEQALPQEQ